MTVMGLALGGVAAYGLTRAMASLLNGVEPGDPSTYAVAVGVLLAVAGLAWLAAGAERRQRGPGSDSAGRLADLHEGEEGEGLDKGEAEQQGDADGAGGAGVAGHAFSG